MLEITLGRSGREELCALCYSLPSHWKIHSVPNCRWSKAGWQRSRWRLIATWKGINPPLHIPTSRGILGMDAGSHEPPKQEHNGCGGSGGDNLSPLETLQPVSTKGRMLRSGRAGEEMKWRKPDRKAWQPELGSLQEHLLV